jgi:putative SOS response-associated peptidase YedK
LLTGRRFNGIWKTAVTLEAGMCGRFSNRTSAEKIKKEFKVSEVPSIEARYNIAPTQNILGISQEEAVREAKLFKWGLIPSWAKDMSIGAKLINARSETVMEKPSFREAFKRRRCIIPADGFYEWQKTNGRKQPYYFFMRDGHPFGFAGLWDRWKSPEDEILETCTILTTEANETVKNVHDRMPVILHPTDYDLWLDDDPRKLSFLKELLRPYSAEEMVSHPVSTLVNNVRVDREELIEQATNSY